MSKQKKYEKLYETLRNINKAVITVLTEEKLYEIVAKALVEELDIKFVWIGKPSKDNKHIEKVYSYGEDEGYLKFIEGHNYTSNKFNLLNVLKQERVFINSDTEKNNILKPWKEEMVNRNFMSSAIIPIKNKGKIHAFLFVYSKEPLYFEEENRTLLEELERDLSFSIEKINSIKDSVLLKNAIENSSQWILITNEQGEITYVNDYVCEITGYKKEELIGKNPNIFKSGYHDTNFYQRLWNTILSGKEFKGIFVNRKKNGELFYLEQTIFPVKVPNSRLKFISIGLDITKEKELSEENEKLKIYDVLTNTYNYKGFALKVDDYISNFPEAISALIVIDIMNFSYINKTYSVEYGDKLLKKIATLLKQQLESKNIKNIIGRIGGDEFGILIQNLKHKNNIYLIVEHIENILDREIHFDNNKHEVKLGYHIGVTIYPDDGKNFKGLIENVSVALKHAKQEGSNIANIFNKTIESEMNSIIKAEKLIQKALKENLFVFYYQPYFDVKNKEIAGFESLVRILDKNGILHYPNEFINVLEESIYLDEFICWALEEVIKNIKKWNKPISINITAKTFKDLKFLRKLTNHINELQVPLVLEITERLYMSEPELSEKIINSLKEFKNIKIAIDDFGTGYSSLSYLRNIKADFLKIDISFIRAMLEDKRAKSIVKTIIQLAKDLDMKTIAEGVEKKIQYEILMDMGVDYIQGFLLSKPLPQKKVESLYK